MSESFFLSTYTLLNSAQRKKGIIVVVLMIINAMLDFFSLASFIPILMLMVNPSFLSDDTLVSRLYHFLGFNSPTAFMIGLTFAVLLLVILKSQINQWISHARARYAYGIANDFGIRTFEYFMQLNYSVFPDADRAKELRRISTHPIAFANNIILPVTTIISEACVSALILIGITLFDYKVLSLIGVILIPAILIYWFRRKSLKEINQELKVKYPLLTKYVLQMMEGLPEIQVYKKGNFFLERFRGVNEKITGILLKDQSIQNSSARMIEIAMGVVVCSLVIYSVSVQQDYHRTLMLLGIYAGASFRVLPSVNRILYALQQIKIHEYLFEELKDSTAPRPIRVKSALTFNFKKTLEWRNISFAYSGHPPLLHDVSLVVHKGEKIGLTGKSGEGKSTLLMILLRLLKTTTGEIFVDGKPLPDPESSPAIFGYVPQNPYLLDGTIAENIAFGIPAASIDRSKVLHLIGELDLHGLIAQMPDGVDTRIGERGMKLSGGQLQRLAIARALYIDSEILMLDEITNQLQASIEDEILNLLEKLSEKGTTILIVTHQINRPGYFDSVYYLEAGKLIKK